MTLSPVQLSARAHQQLRDARVPSPATDRRHSVPPRRPPPAAAHRASAINCKTSAHGTPAKRRLPEPAVLARPPVGLPDPVETEREEEPKEAQEEREMEETGVESPRAAKGDSFKD